jgi:NAD(P)-dependent dehydrogenase (short-subunit alcohol dehydrogenase family)
MPHQFCWSRWSSMANSAAPGLRRTPTRTGSVREGASGQASSSKPSGTAEAGTTVTPKPCATSRTAVEIWDASITAFNGLPGATTYSAAKAAARSYARTWAAEFADRGLRVNVLSPGPFDTPIIDAQAEYFGQDPAALRAHMATLVPLGRLGRPEELAAAAVFLASDESSFMTGAELCIDGGMGQI